MPELTEYFGVKKEWIAEQAGELTKLRVLTSDSFEIINRFFKDVSNKDKAKIHIFAVTLLDNIKLK